MIQLLRHAILVAAKLVKITIDITNSVLIQLYDRSQNHSLKVNNYWQCQHFREVFEAHKITEIPTL